MKAGMRVGPASTTQTTASARCIAGLYNQGAKAKSLSRLKADGKPER